MSSVKSKAISLSSFSTSAKLSGHVNIYYTTVVSGLRLDCLDRTKGPLSQCFHAHGHCFVVTQQSFHSTFRQAEKLTMREQYTSF